MGGSSSQPESDLPPLPTQQVVGSGAHHHHHQQQLQASEPVLLAKHQATDQVRMTLIWDKSALNVQRLGGDMRSQWRVSGSFEAKVPCEFVTAFHCRESFQDGRFTFSVEGQAPPAPQPVRYPAGKHTVTLDIDLLQWPLEAFWKYRNSKPDVMPIVWELKASDGTQSLMFLALKFEGYNLIPALLKQKVSISGKEHILQEVYGLAELGKDDEHNESTVGDPCVICLSSARNTAVLPCHHLCVCEACGGSLLGRAAMSGMNCPICRGPVGDLKVFDLVKKT